MASVLSSLIAGFGERRRMNDDFWWMKPLGFISGIVVAEITLKVWSGHAVLIDPLLQLLQHR